MNLMFILGILLVAVVAYYIIDKSFPGDINWIAKLIVGIILILALLQAAGLGVAFAAMLL